MQYSDFRGGLGGGEGVSGSNVRAAGGDKGDNGTYQRLTNETITVNGEDVWNGAGDGWRYDLAAEYVHLAKNGCYDIRGVEVFGHVLVPLKVPLANTTYSVQGLADVATVKSGENGEVPLYLAPGDYDFTLDGHRYTFTLVEGESVPEWSVPVDYVGADGESHEVVAFEIDADTRELRDGRWYVARGNVGLRTLDVSGQANLILAKDARLTVSAGFSEAAIHLTAEGSLSIYGQEAGSGELIAVGGSLAAGIGGDDHEIGGALNIYGGRVTAVGGESAPGIGGGGRFEGNGCQVTIAGGTVSATGGDEGVMTFTTSTIDLGTGDTTNSVEAYEISISEVDIRQPITTTTTNIFVIATNIVEVGGITTNIVETEAGVTTNIVEVETGVVTNIVTGTNVVIYTETYSKGQCPGIGGCARCVDAGTLTITGGSVSMSTLQVLSRAHVQPKGANGEDLHCMTLVVGDTDAKITSLGGDGFQYGMRDVEPIDGKLYLWLPEGRYDYSVNGLASPLPMAVYAADTTYTRSAVSLCGLPANTTMDIHGLGSFTTDEDGRTPYFFLKDDYYYYSFNAGDLFFDFTVT